MTTKVKLLHDTIGIPTGAVAVIQSASDNTTKVATTAYVTTAVSNLVDGAPSTLNTLNEIAAALNDDAALNTTLTNSIAAKAPLASPTFTTTITTPDINITGGSQIGQDYAYLKSNSTTTASLTLRKDSTGADSIDFLQLRADGNGLIGKIEGDGDISFKNATFSGTISSGAITSTGTSAFSDVTIGAVGDSQSLIQMLANSTNGANTIHFGDATSGTASYTGYINYAHNTNEMQFANNGGNVRMRVDSSGNVMIGKTAANTTAAGHTFFQYGRHGVTVNSTTCQIINRLGNDGTITLFEKDNAAIGTVNVLSGRMGIGSGDTGIFFDSTRDCISPFSVTANDGQTGIDLGRTAIKFKDLHLSGYTYSTGFTSATSMGGIGVSQGDVNGMELGRGYLTLSRDDNADADQILLMKNGNLHTKMITINNGFKIHHQGSDIHIMTSEAGTPRRINFSGSIPSFKPFDSNTSQIDLGTTSAKWKDVYLSGRASVGHVVPNTAGTYSVNHLGVYSNGITVNAATSQTGYLMSAGTGIVSWNNYGGKIKLGGTAAANELDDYEEGIWIPAMVTSGGVTTSSISYYAMYTKIGRVCHIHAKITATLSSLPGQTVAISGLPFPAKDSSDSQQRAIIAIGGDTQNTGGNTPKAHFRTNGSQLQGVYWNASNNTAYWAYNAWDSTSFEIHVHGHYITA
jgi:hypothetical protein